MKMKMKKVSVEHLPFLGVLLLFSGFALYGIFSFNTSLGDHLEGKMASVLGEDLLADGGEFIDPAWLTFETSAAEEIFIDVSTSHPNATAVSYFKQMGFIEGYDDGTFQPDKLVNRAEFLKILTSVLEVDFAGGVYEGCFNDVPDDEWYSVFVCYAKESAWVAGYNGNLFMPNKTITKDEALKMTLLAMEVSVPEIVTEKPYTDVEADSWLSPYAKVAKDGNIVQGLLFFPSIEMSRAETVQLMYNALLYVGSLDY